MGEPGADAIERPALIRSVVVAEHLTQVVERGAFHLRALHPPAADFAQLALEESDSVDTIGRVRRLTEDPPTIGPAHPPDSRLPDFAGALVPVRRLVDVAGASVLAAHRVPSSG